jgi:acetyltransferase-like isoleucine patch superfamily enzyme
VEDEWRTSTGLTREEFARFTRYCNQSDNSQDNLNRARALGIPGENVRIAPGAIVRLKDLARIGRNSFIGLYCYVNGDVTIGADVLIGPHCSITSNNHIYDPATASFSGNRGAPISIGDGVWLASGCTVTAGVAVARGNLICANAVVTKSTPEFAIMAGTPARQIGRIDPITGAYEWFTSDERSR